MALSKVESRYAKCSAIVDRDSFFSIAFSDGDGCPFRAKHDGVIAGSNIYIEFKSGALNSKRTMASSYNGLLAQCKYFQYSHPSFNYDASSCYSLASSITAYATSCDRFSARRLLSWREANSWSNSRYKQAVVT